MTNLVAYKVKRIDKLLMHRFWGLLIFFLLLFAIFETTFGLGYYPVLWIEKLVFYFENYLQNSIGDGFVKSLLLYGIVKGVGGVVVFLPNIIILYLLITIMEESGYMLRVSAVMDKALSRFGLNGKSFFSLVMGLGCTVPAIMAAQQIGDKKTRLVTILVNPLISCGSRFTVYVLFISLFFNKYSGLILFSIYMFSVILVALVALALKKYLLMPTHSTFTPVLIPLRVPSLKRIGRSIYNNSVLFLKKIIGAILISSIIIWLLMYFPSRDASHKDIEHSYIGMIGKGIQPAMAPLGFDWKMCVSLLTGIAAKETIVGTLNELYQNPHANQAASLSADDDSILKNVFSITPLQALSFMFFVSIYTPCIAVLTSIRKVSRSRKWTLFVILYTTMIAWIVAFGIFQAGLALGF
ncbi:MAG: ferrous iron transporter B [Bacteroidota bacterium]